jgi:hypothetical protein
MACRVCTHPATAAIDAALSTGSSPLASLAETHSLTRDQLNWHKRRHLAGKPAQHASPDLPPVDVTTFPHGSQPRGIAQTGTSEYARERFLRAFARSGNITYAAKIAGVGRRTVYVWQEHEPGFAEAFAEAGHKATEALEREAWRRAKDGVAEPVYQHGKLVGTIQRYSDNLLMFLLKARAPERYRDRVDVSVTPVIKAVSGFDPADVL